MLIIATIVVLLIATYFISNKKSKSSKKCAFDVFPQPPADFMGGHTRKTLSPKRIIKVTSEFLKYGNTVTLNFAPIPIWSIRKVLLTQDYKFVEFLLTSNKILAKSENYRYLSAWLGNGLILSDGDYWRKHRKILTPAFHFEILKDFVEIFETVGNVLVKKLGHYEGADSVDLHPLVTLCTLDIICETAMGTKMNIQNGQNSDYVHNVKEMCRISTVRAIVPHKVFDWMFWFTQDFTNQRTGLQTLHSFTREMINSKRVNRGEKKSKKEAFLDLLLKFSHTDDVLSDEEIREEVDNFMFAGHHTTAAGICFALFCLANNPEAQQKAFQEQSDLFGDEKNPEVTYADLQNMKYLERVIKETFRLYPPIPAIGRYTTEEIEFEDCVIPKHTNIVISVYGMHRNPDYFPDPEKFAPERFEHFDSSLPYAYIPFSAGPRNCIGQKFAMLELKSIVSKIVRHFEIGATTPRHELRLSVEAVMNSANGVKVTLRKRH